MKCPECGFEGILEDEKFCGECGAVIRTEESKWDLPKWKWGSLIASTVLVFLFWSFVAIFAIFLYVDFNNAGFQLGLAIFGFPAIIYLMYKERTEKIKYGIVWIVFPLLVALPLPLVFLGSMVGLFPYYPITGGRIFTYFIIFVIPAIVIDIWYVRKLNEVGK